MGCTCRQELNAQHPSAPHRALGAQLFKTWNAFFDKDYNVKAAWRAGLSHWQSQKRAPKAPKTPDGHQRQPQLLRTATGWQEGLPEMEGKHLFREDQCPLYSPQLPAYPASVVTHRGGRGPEGVGVGAAKQVWKDKEACCYTSREDETWQEPSSCVMHEHQCSWARDRLHLVTSNF